MSNTQYLHWTFPTKLSGNNEPMQQICRRILADNIKLMIEKRQLSVRGWALEHNLDPRQMDRLVKRQYSTTVDTLEQIAEAIGVQPWQLLVPNMSLEALPMLVMGSVERDLYENVRALVKKAQDK